MHRSKFWWLEFLHFRLDLLLATHRQGGVQVATVFTGVILPFELQVVGGDLFGHS